MSTETRPVGTETLSDVEISKKAHETMADLASRILTTPEFTAALGKGYFRRNITHPDVYFEKNGVEYRVYYKAEPNRFESRYIQNYDATISLSVDKYDPKQETDGNHKQIGSVNLYTYFTEDQNGEVTNYRGGSISVEDETGSEQQNSAEALGLIPQVLSDFYQPIKL